tara:strand:- start:204 stop:830 length:627 start_codon:yes stop_codon:yes gene_type:complete
MKKNNNSATNKDAYSEKNLWELVKKSANPLNKKEIEQCFVPNNSLPLNEKNYVKEKYLTKKHIKNDKSQFKDSNKIPRFETSFKESQSNFSGIDKRTYSRLRKGKISIEDTLDMHGMSQKKAFESIKQFINASIEKNFRCVLVITGKGENKNSFFEQNKKNIGILKESLPKWLSEKEISRNIITHSVASIKHGGSGARYILLRKKNKL